MNIRLSQYKSLNHGFSVTLPPPPRKNRYDLFKLTRYTKGRGEPRYASRPIYFTVMIV